MRLFLLILLAASGLASQDLSVEEGLARGRSLEARGANDSALAAYTDVTTRHPRDWRGFMLRGSLSFRLGDNERALEDFDRVVALAPGQEPYLWQRGIAQYYARDFTGCARQFELHRTVNGADVENSVWHFLCRARLSGVESARAELLPVGPDPRVPMREVYELFAGRMSVEDVLGAARDEPTRQEMNLFYAELYVGLYLEATGQGERAREHLVAAADAPVGGYMRDVARVHLGSGPPPKE